MKKIFLSKILMATALFTAVFFTACQKDANLDDNNVETLITASEDVSNANAYTQSTEDEIDMSIEQGPIGGSSACPTITFSAARGTFPQTITVDFGAACTDRNGRVRKGQIIIVLSDSLTKLNATKTVTYQNYFIDSVKVEGTRTWKNTGLNASGQPTFTRTATNMKLTFADGTFATWTANHTVSRTQGFNTPRLPIDDEWSVSGTESGVNRRGNTFNSTITSPVVHKAACVWIVSGVRSLTVNGSTKTLDYGNGDCDRQATLTLANGNTRTITLRR